MIDTEESGVLDDVHAFLVAVVWMGAPVDIGQKASGLAKPAFFRGFLDVHGFHESAGPIAELPGMAGRAGEELIELRRRDEQRILPALLHVEHFIKQPFPHAGRRNHDFAWPRPANDLVEHDGAIGKKRPPRRADRVDRNQRFGIRPFDEAREIGGVGGGDDIAVGHGERIIALAHVQLGERPPGAADRVESASREPLGDGRPGQCLADNLDRRARRTSRGVH